MLVTITNQGASVPRVELSSLHYLDLDAPHDPGQIHTGGYLGHVLADDTNVVRVVGAGTPASLATPGPLEPGDRITAVNGTLTRTAEEVRKVLASTEPGDVAAITVQRDGKTLDLEATLRQRPLDVIRPEHKDRLDRQSPLGPFSFLMTLREIDEETIPEDEEEIPGVDLRTANWEIVEWDPQAGDWAPVAPGNRSDPDAVSFRHRLVDRKLEVIKTFRLAKLPAGADVDEAALEAIEEDIYPAYHLEMTLDIRNLDPSRERKIAYQLDGPNGLPTEGYWYANKVGRSWSAGLRDVVMGFGGDSPKLVYSGCPSIAKGDVEVAGGEQPLTFAGVDAQYFSVMMMPQRPKGDTTIWFADGGAKPILVGNVDEQWLKLANTSCRLNSIVSALEPAGTEADSLQHSYRIFAGPKKPALLAQPAYHLGELVYYGWFNWLARPMVFILHTFYSLIANFGVAILMLTALVRLCMFPLSKKQAESARKMQEIQPELKKLVEKYKKNMEARMKAQRELFRKHNYNPAAGCLLLFVQLPIFVALYRSLMVDVELRGAPLFSHLIRWCNNLAAPDKFLDWFGFMPAAVTGGHTFLIGLGPYFNILPILTVFLFLWQQKQFMPPPTDDQQAMQQKIMKFMMIFIGFLFFKVASGLCLYFIASSLWGMGERRFLPKHGAHAAATRTEPTPAAKPKARPQPTSGGNGAPIRKRKGKKSRGQR